MVSFYHFLQRYIKQSERQTAPYSKGTINHSPMEGCRIFFPTKKKNSEHPSGRIRDITAHLIHDKNTSITVSCTVFNFPSAGNDPGWIYWSYEFLFFRPRGLRTRRPAQTGPRGQNLAFQRFEPIILRSFFMKISKNNIRKA